MTDLATAAKRAIELGLADEAVPTLRKLATLADNLGDAIEDGDGERAARIGRELFPLLTEIVDALLEGRAEPELPHLVYRVGTQHVH